jgi:hypothetical protein
MEITVVCSFCRCHDIDPKIEINFKDGKIYYVCKDCKKENSFSLVVQNKPFPKTRRI